MARGERIHVRQIFAVLCAAVLAGVWVDPASRDLFEILGLLEPSRLSSERWGCLRAPFSPFPW